MIKNRPFTLHEVKDNALLGKRLEDEAHRVAIALIHLAHFEGLALHHLSVFARKHRTFTQRIFLAVGHQVGRGFNAPLATQVAKAQHGLLFGEHHLAGIETNIGIANHGVINHFLLRPHTAHGQQGKQTG